MDQEYTRVLLVEDDPADVVLVERSLESPSNAASFDIQHAATLQQGLDRLAKGDMDVLMLDLHLPDSQGTETVARAREADAEIPLVVFTTAGDDRTALAALEVGADDYVVKLELNGSLLRRAIRYAMARQRLRQASSRIRDQIRRSEQRESLGVLAGGLAHDFNNLITVILGNAQLLRDDLPEDSLVRPKLGAIVEAAYCAAGLTSQLLTYSGRARPPAENIDLSAEVRRAEVMLGSLLPANAQLHTELADGLPFVEGDSSQIQQLLMNLVVNAGEAMGVAPGSIEIQTAARELDESEVQDLSAGGEVRPGAFVELRVRDSGCGMDEGTMKRIFDPFFSTKFTGRGLGLASSLGIVRLHRGGIRVESSPGCGTTFTLYFPAAGRGEG